MNNRKRNILLILGGLVFVAGLTLLTGWFNADISQAIEKVFTRHSSPNWPFYMIFLGCFFSILGGLFISVYFWGSRLPATQASLRAALATSDEWLQLKFADKANLAASYKLQWPVAFNLLDWLALLTFIILALIMQLASSRNGFPNVILGGDAANIASFAAGRAFPQLFSNDAILGNLDNIGLYTTIHLPITIALEKLVGNFGLAYSLLLFPHVFLQYFSYYLLGRVLFHNRYWAYLFTLVISSPMTLAGGELWGVTGDAMPRFTFQVLIPFLIILMLTVWRERPNRWVWLMVIAGLMAFIHPVSTPPWAFALWLGLWPIMPSIYGLRQKLVEMVKMGLVLAIALLPYVSIYLYFHKGGGSSSNYDLVYFILTNYFPFGLMDIPFAVRVLINSTSHFGLLWYGLAGLGLTFFLFRSERNRLAQMLTWMAGISFVTILIPFVEQVIERTFRIIPLQTELMRGMRYLVPFLFIFWFYPFAEMTRRSIRRGLTRSVFLIGTLLTLVWLGLNPPYPFTETPGVVSCWAQGHFICPTNEDYAETMTYIREETPQNAQFVVFLTSRWSGIEVRYLGLRPMAYAYKDRGQLTFTNLDALQTWFYFLQRENIIYSRNLTPTLELQQQRMVKFAFDAEANYLLTDYPFPPDVLQKLDVKAVYQKGTFTILQIYPVRQ